MNRKGNHQAVRQIPDLKYPNDDYRRVLSRVLSYYQKYPDVYAIVLTGSLARGKAVDGSCIDLCIFLGRKSFNDLPSTLNSRAKAYSRLRGKICYYEGRVEGGVEFGNIRVDLQFTTGKFDPSSENSFDIVRDEFETTIGNLFVYGVALYEKGAKYQRLRNRYLPFYDDKLRRARLKGTAEEFKYKIWKTRWLAKRCEFFASLEALLEAQRIFLQHLFIKERKYPIDYTKWLEEQAAKVLGMPSLYQELASCIDGIALTENEISNRSNLLERLFTRYSSQSSAPLQEQP